MTALEWANQVELCMRLLGPDDAPPHSIVDFPAQYNAIVKVIEAAVAEEREACARIADRESDWWKRLDPQDDRILAAQRVAAEIRLPRLSLMGNTS